MLLKTDCHLYFILYINSSFVTCMNLQNHIHQTAFIFYVFLLQYFSW